MIVHARLNTIKTCNVYCQKHFNVKTLSLSLPIITVPMSWKFIGFVEIFNI